ncbi:DUF3974 domain-containing protein [Bacillus cereus group sp. BfR-BA-01380]|uniref:DUF3974 domain-containing protein n=1 Tax=Bacillus cereus group sp. BfR-BA-01380 TaxID=2920324 RepID=UPI001F579708|nr:DUF3974 domain-containing protein [Bacillus cereus group sp. BfR-BA-01380]
MGFFEFILLLIGIVLLLGLTAVILLAYFGRKFYVSWKKPYKRTTDSMERLSHSTVPFLQEFTQHPLFYRWIRTEGSSSQKAFTVLFCTANERTKEQIFSMLPREKQKKLHYTVKTTKQVTSEDMEMTTMKVKEFLKRELQQPSKPNDFSFYKLYFYDRYPDALKHIQMYKRSVNPSLQRCIDDVTISVLQAIPYYQENRMFEQQHKLETFLMKDLVDMLSLIAQIPPAQRSEKEEELTIYLKGFQKEMEAVERNIRNAVDYDLQVKMRAAKEKFKN